jgi:predicted RNA-binding protein YlxR (DUF448 family)
LVRGNPGLSDTGRSDLSDIAAEAEPDDESGPLRRCIATGERRDPAGMIRFVVGPEDRLVPDIGGKLPGRGIWVCANGEALKRAIAKHLFARAARRAVLVDPGLAAIVEGLIERQCLDMIGLARRAGNVAAGFEKVEAMLRRGPVGALIAAREGAADGRDKLRRLAPDAPVVATLPAAGLAQALGREGILIHAAMARGPLADRLVAASERLAGLRGAG